MSAIESFPLPPPLLIDILNTSIEVVGVCISCFITWCCILEDYTLPTLPLLCVCVVIHGFQLLFMEQAVSLCSCLLGDPEERQKHYYVVGTAFVDPADKEPSCGRVIILEVVGKYF